MAHEAADVQHLAVFIYAEPIRLFVHEKPAVTIHPTDRSNRCSEGTNIHALQRRMKAGCVTYEPELLLLEEEESEESESLDESEEEESDEEEEDEEDDEDESEDSTSCFWVMIILGAFFKCSLSSSLRRHGDRNMTDSSTFKEKDSF